MKIGYLLTFIKHILCTRNCYKGFNHIKLFNDLNSFLKYVWLLDSFYNRDITLSTKICLVKAMVFPVVMYGCERWTIRKLSAEELMLLNCGVGEYFWESQTGRRSNQSILKEISPGCSLEGLMLKLKLQYSCYLMRRTDSLEKDPDAGKDWGQEEKGMIED